MFDKSQNQLSVTLSHTATHIEENNNNIAGTGAATNNARSSLPNSDSVSVIAAKIRGHKGRRRKCFKKIRLDRMIGPGQNSGIYIILFAIGLTL